MKNNFENLKIWERSHSLVLNVYKLTRLFPKSELYGLTSQLRRVAASVPANIVEGYSRKSKKEFLQFLYQARVSLDETIYFLILSKDLGYITESDLNRLKQKYSVLMKMLNSFISKIKAKL